MIKPKTRGGTNKITAKNTTMVRNKFIRILYHNQ